MAVQEIKPEVFYVGAKHWDRKMFDALIPLPDGTSYNAYIIKGSEKTVLIDTVDPAKTWKLMENLEKLNVTKLDYVVANHAEQDHSGSIPAILEKYPEAKVVTNEKCKSFLLDHLLITEDKFIVMADRETLSLGNKTLEFVLTPWVHWPETMCTYLQEDKILFSCDFFGSHLATSNLFVRNEYRVVEDAKRYYAEIMMPFRAIIKKNIAKVETLDFEIIAPSHGPLYDKPEIIVEAYKEWISDNVENVVLIPYVSMHESTEKMASYLTDKLMEKGITVKPFNLISADLGHLAMALVDAATIIIGTPTVLAGPHPAAVYAATLVNALKPKTKYATIIGSYGWGGKAVEVLQANLNRIKVEFLEPILIKGHPTGDDYHRLDKLAEEIHKRHQEL
ncbi:MAG: FprA family A-type flavoprotein [bacterium]|nr:FprA family A-type flavoprotein [bacterium]